MSDRRRSRASSVCAHSVAQLETRQAVTAKLTNKSTIANGPPIIDAPTSCSTAGAMRLMNHSGRIFRELRFPSEKIVLLIALADSNIRIYKDGEIDFDGGMSAGTAKVFGSDHIRAADILSRSDVLVLPFEKRHFVDAVPLAGAKYAALHRGDVEFTVRGDHIENFGKRFLAATWKERPSVARDFLLAVFDPDLGAPRVRSLPAWRLKRVENHIKANLSNSVKLADMACVAGLSRMHFAAAFKAATSYSPHEYVTMLRIEEAKRELLGTTKRIVDIALGLGYDSQAHFSTTFKRFSGFTPAEWRRGELPAPAPETVGRRTGTGAATTL